MLKTLLKSSAVVAVIAIGAGPAAVMAQSSPEPSTPGTMAPEPLAPASPDASGTMAPESGSMAADPTAPMAAPADLATLSADELIGADIKTGADNETVASVQDVLLNSDGTVKNIVARFGGFLGFGETTVLLMPDEVMAHKMDDGKVELTTTLTPEALKDRPEYKAPSN